MRSAFDKDISEVRTALVLTKREAEAYEKQVAAANSAWQTLEEQCRLTEEQILASQMEMRTAEREIAELKRELRERKLVTKQDVNPLDSLEKFVTVSETVFASEGPKAAQESLFASTLKQSSNEALREVAEAAQAILRLKKDIPLLTKAEKELGKRKKEDRRTRIEEVIRTDLARVAENSILVLYTDILGQRQECQFPVITADGYKLTFSELLVHACRYWLLYDRSFVLIDKEYKVLPGTAVIQDELVVGDRVVTLVPKDQLEDGTARADAPLLEHLLAKSDIESSKSQTIETSRMDQEAYSTEENKLHKLRRKQERVQLVKKRRLLNVINLLIYIAFVALFTWVLSEVNDILQNYNLRASVEKTVLTREFPDYGNDGFAFGDIVNEKYFEMFIMQPFLSMFGDGTEEERSYFNGYLRKVGLIRILQKRVKNKSCTYDDYKGSLGNYRRYCYADFSPESEETTDLLIPGLPNEYHYWAHYRHYESPRAISVSKGQYDLEGYEIYLLSNASRTNVEPVLRYMLDNWIDLQTRLLVIDVNFCNQNIDVCVAFELIFEFLASGSIVPKEYFYQYRVNRNWTTKDKIRQAFEYTIDAIMLYFIFSIVQECRLNGLRKSAKEIWLLMELMLILMVFVRQLMIILYEQQSLIKDFDINTQSYHDFMAPAYIYKLLTNFEGVALFFAYLTMFKFLQSSSSISIISGTLLQSILSMLFFFMIFAMIFMGWVLLSYKLFGKDTIDYKSMSTSANTLMQVILGENNLDVISQFDLYSASIFFICASLLNNFIMLNIFLAIINESYDTVYKRVKKVKKDELLIILGMILKGFKLVLIDLPLGLVLFRPCRKRKPQDSESAEKSDTELEAYMEEEESEEEPDKASEQVLAAP